MDLNALKTKVQGWLKYLGYIIAVIFLVMWGITSIQKNNLSDKNQLQAVKLMAQNDSTKVYKDKAGDYYAKFQAVGIQKENLKEALNEMGLNNKTLKEKNIKQGDVISALEFKVKAMGDILANVKDSVIHDTITGKPDEVLQTIKWNDSHLYLNGYIQEKLFKGNYTYHLDLSTITEKKGKSYIVTAYSPNKGVVITNGSQIVVTPKVTFWSKVLKWTEIAAAFEVGHLIK